MRGRGATSAAEARAAHRRTAIIALLARGIVNHHEIAARLGLRPTTGRVTVTKDIKIILKEARKRFAEKATEHAIREIQKLNAIEREAWKAWDRSCEPRRIVTRCRRLRPQPPVAEGQEPPERQILWDEEDVKEEPRHGDPRFLEIIKGCCKMRAELQGLLKDEARKAEPPPRIVGINVFLTGPPEELPPEPMNVISGPTVQ
jgi:hypothetical protein